MTCSFSFLGCHGGKVTHLDHGTGSLAGGTYLILRGEGITNQLLNLILLVFKLCAVNSNVSVLERTENFTV